MTRELAFVLSGGFLKSFCGGIFVSAIASFAGLPSVSATDVAVFSGVGYGFQIIASLCSGRLAARFGFHTVAFVSSVLSLLAIVLLVVSPSDPDWMAAGGAIKGLFFGLVAALTPMLLTLASPADRSASDSTLFQFVMQAGVLWGVLFGAASVWCFPDEPCLSMRVSFALMALPAAVHFLCLRALPKNPFVSANYACAATCPSRIRSVVLCGVLFALLSFAGIGIVSDYSVILFVWAGLTTASANLASAVMKAVVVVAVLLTVGFSRRCDAGRLVIGGAALSAVCLSLALFAHGWFFSALVVASVAVFHAGASAGSWALVQKALPIGLRTVWVPVLVVVGQLATWPLTTFFFPVLESFGVAPMFLFFILSDVLIVLLVALGLR